VPLNGMRDLTGCRHKPNCPVTGETWPDSSHDVVYFRTRLHTGCAAGSLRAKIRDDDNVAAKQKKVEGNIDFGIFDSKVVLLWVLDESSRRWKRGEVVLDERRVKEYAEFFDALFREATGFRPQKKGGGVELMCRSGDVRHITVAC